MSAVLRQRGAPKPVILLKSARPRLEPLFPAEQARDVQLLVERVDIGTAGLNARLRINVLAALAREMSVDLEQVA